MTLMDRVKQRILKFLGMEHLDENPNSPRYQFISNAETVKKQHLDEYRVWYVGDSDELNNFYLNREVSGNAKEPIYNRNVKKYFWGLSQKECDVKKIHSGIPRAAICTLSNAIGSPIITSDLYQNTIDKILRKNHFSVLLNQQARPLTLAEGWGAFKPVFNKAISDTVLIEYYEAQDVEFVVECGIIIGIIYKDYYNYQNRNYVLLETRRIDQEDAIVEYELYRLEKSNEVRHVELEELPDLAKLPKEGYRIRGLKRLLGVPNRYFHDILNKEYGLSILAGKLDICDDMDMILSVESETEKNSGPVEYYPVDLLKRDKNGQPKMPSIFGRKFVKKPVVPSADGGEDGKIDTSAPDLNFDKYSMALIHKVQLFLSGMLSPATMGIDIAKKDNAEAQREKEKVTIMTRDNVIAAETECIKDLIELCLMLQEYMNTGSISLQEYDISVKYSEFANGSFETRSQILTPMWSQGAISDELFVEKLYGDGMSAREKEEEVAKIKENKQSMDINALGGIDETGNREDLPASGEEQEEPEFATI